MYYWLLLIIFLRSSLAEFDFSDDTFTERLNRIVINSSDNVVLDVEMVDEFPEYTEISCENVDGKEGDNHRVCRGRNICFGPDHNTLVVLNRPIGTENVKVNLAGPADLSPVHFYHPDGLTSHGILNKGELVTVIRSETILYFRYLPSNFYHRFHDDFMPLLALIASHDRLSQSNRTLMFVDKYESYKTNFYYNILGNVLSTADLEINYRRGSFPTRFYCLQNAWMSVPRKTTWYRHGLKGRVFGPETLFPPSVMGPNVRKAADWIKRQNNALDPKGLTLSPLYSALLNGQDYPAHMPRLKLSVIRRSYNRRILNEAELLDALAKAFPQIEVAVLMEETSDRTPVVIRQAAESFAIIGVHGALLTATMFMPAGSMLIEILPYATSTDVVGYFKVLAGLPAVDIHYRNMVSVADTELTTTAIPDLSILPASYQDGIMTNTQVPNYHCCSNVFWTFRKEQNVVADIPLIISSLREMMQDELDKSSSK